MSLANILDKIRGQVAEVAPGLELFTDASLQPTTADCEQLQSQLHQLLENLAVYKYTKQMHELSPSFKIHARISELAPVQPETRGTHETPKPKEHDPAPIEAAVPPAPPVVSAPTATEPRVTAKDPAPHAEPAPAPKTPVKQLSIGLNDKFRFINELFAQNNSEYNIALQQLNTVNSWRDAEVYLNSLKNLYGWKENNEVLKYFYALVKKRFE